MGCTSLVLLTHRFVNETLELDQGGVTALMKKREIKMEGILPLESVETPDAIFCISGGFKLTRGNVCPLTHQQTCTEATHPQHVKTEPFLLSMRKIVSNNSICQNIQPPKPSSCLS